MKALSIPVAMAGAALLTSLGASQDRTAYRVSIKDGPTAFEELTLPIDPTIRIQPAHANGPQFGLTVEGKRITCSPNGSIWHQVRIDGNATPPFFVNGNNMAPTPLPKTPNGKERHGFETKWTVNNIEIAMIVEVVPSKPYGTMQPGQKRKMDTCRISYIAENKDSRARTVEFRANVDMLVNNNDGALYSSPTTDPGKVLNGVILKDDKLPEYVLSMERPDADNPGFCGCITLKFGKSQAVDGPNKIILTNLGVIGQGDWECAAQPAGDSACAVYWGPKELQPKQKRTMVWAYGGGIASSPENEGRVTMDLKGSFEPNKLFTITAYVDDPSPSQSLALQLPAGVQCIEGRELQPVPPAASAGVSLVQWKARVIRPGDYDLRIRSSTGMTQSKLLSVQPVN